MKLDIYLASVCKYRLCFGAGTPPPPRIFHRIFCMRAISQLVRSQSKSDAIWDARMQNNCFVSTATLSQHNSCLNSFDPLCLVKGQLVCCPVGPTSWPLQSNSSSSSSSSSSWWCARSSVNGAKKNEKKMKIVGPFFELWMDHGRVWSKICKCTFVWLLFERAKQAFNEKSRRIDIQEQILPSK